MRGVQLVSSPGCNPLHPRSAVDCTPPYATGGQRRSGPFPLLKNGGIGTICPMNTALCPVFAVLDGLQIIIGLYAALALGLAIGALKRANRAEIKLHELDDKLARLAGPARGQVRAGLELHSVTSMGQSGHRVLMSGRRYCQGILQARHAVLHPEPEAQLEQTHEAHEGLDDGFPVHRSAREGFAGDFGAEGGEVSGGRWCVAGEQRFEVGVESRSPFNDGLNNGDGDGWIHGSEFDAQC